MSPKQLGVEMSSSLRTFLTMQTIRDSIGDPNADSACSIHPGGVDPNVIIADDESFGESSEEIEVKKPTPKK
jgi:hypothetical protein